MTSPAHFAEFSRHLLEDEKPARYFEDVSEMPIFKAYPFSLLYALKDCPQSPEHHPEGNVWNHTLLVVNEAAAVREKSRDPAVLMWSALLHDIGKPSATKMRKGKLTAYDHDKVGAELAKKFLAVFTEDVHFIDAVYQMIRYHMQLLFVVNSLPFADIPGLRQNTDIRELALLGLCDRLGRTNSDRIKEEKNVAIFLKKSMEDQGLG